jgi:hypothetical protein
VLTRYFASTDLNGGSQEHGDDAAGPNGNVKAANLPPPDVAAGIPCRFFPLGQCKYGDKCAFSHRGSPQLANGHGHVDGNLPPSQAPSPSQGSQQVNGISPQQSPTIGLPMGAMPTVDYNGYPIPMPPQYYYYGMPQPYYGAPMQYAPQPGYYDANGEFRALPPQPAMMPYGMPYPYPEYTAASVMSSVPMPAASSPPSAPSPMSAGSICAWVSYL